MDPLDFISTIARRCGALLLERFDLAHDVREKGPRDIVTDVDRASEAILVEAVRAEFPAASILGEEGGAYAGSGNERFIIDPLDGTTNYAHRYPLYCVSIAYERDGIVEAAAIDAPSLGLHYTARRGGGSFVNGRTIGVSRTSTLAEALVCTGFNPARYERNGRHFAVLSGLAQGVRRDGSAALDLAFVAEGRFDAFWEWELKAWDVAAGALLVREAGGRISAIDGRSLVLEAGSIAATNGALHAPLIAALELGV